MAHPTFVVARAALLDLLAASGWTLSKRDLKVPHATSPDGSRRFWFKAQAVYVTDRGASSADKHEFGAARTLSYDLDIRAITPAAFLARYGTRG